ncbi:MAG: M18 family aminopeptidase [Candidatus Cloacimonetes bacterium]|nr:M18 family aminopeptidase [Candidatus Cloacimonadota bacterium]MCB5269288.1 M18 family aminopeptidase [Candidatus Cloacimonadota bacterium]
MEHITMNKHLTDFLSFLDSANSRFTASEQITQRLSAAGYTELVEGDSFQLKKGGKYYIRRMDTAVVAFVIGSKSPAESGFKIAASHIDSPSLKLKTQSYKCDRGVSRMGVEVYGGPIVHTWLDRELSVSGRVIVRTAKGSESRIVDLKKPIAIIPNAAIHMNREINKGFEYNKQTHLQAILSVNPKDENPLYTIIAKALKIKASDIVADELYLYDVQKASIIGTDEDMIACGRLDNLAMTHAILQGFLDAGKPKHTSVAVFFDHEEIGSQTPQGAFSSLLAELLERICLAANCSREDFYRSIHQSYLISADMAHAFHPSYAEKYDPDYSPTMNKGPVIKLNANHRYASSAATCIPFMELCDKAKVACQQFLVRSDMPCGSTVGPVLAANLGLSTIDIGNPMWAMHSVRETSGVEDHLNLIKVLKLYYT